MIKLTDKEIVAEVKQWINGDKKRKLDMLESYYNSDNTAINIRHNRKAAKRVTPNVCIPSPYYSTLIDAMSGFMFSNVKYLAETDDDKEYVNALNDVLYSNNVQINDMKTGVSSLAYNRGLELVYTIGDGVNTEIKFSPLDPDEVILIYDKSIEPKLYCAIRISETDKAEYDLDVIYADEWQYKHMKGEAIIDIQEPKQLLFSECPVVEYETSMLTKQAPFENVIPLIDAYDELISGNNEEVSKLSDAILVLGKKVKEEDKVDISEWKLLQDMAAEDRAEFIQRDASPVFREYLSKLLIEEIFKHSHIVDWYNSQNGLSGAASGKALIIRLHDMTTYSYRLEMMYRQGANKRIKLITELMALLKMPTGYCNIEYKRTLPNFVDELITSLNGVDWLSKQTKHELIGVDPAIEKTRLEDEKVEPK